MAECYCACSLIFVPCVLKMAEKGRPRLKVDISQVEHLLSSNLTWEQISNCIGVSVSTVQRRASEINRMSYTVKTG